MVEAKVEMFEQAVVVVAPHLLQVLFLQRRWGRNWVVPGDRDFEAEIEWRVVVSVTFRYRIGYLQVQEFGIRWLSR